MTKVRRYLEEVQVERKGYEEAYPGLSHPEEGESNTDEESSGPCHTPGHTLLILPGTKVITTKSGTEPVVLDEKDRPEGQRPIAQDRKQVVDDWFKLIPAT